MAFIEPISISAPKEQKWVVEISEILNDELKINLEVPSVSIFQVPGTITIKKPEAYEPQHIGLGPIHHFRPGPYEKMEQKKLAIVRKVLREYNIEDHKLIVLNKVRKIVPIIRSCYDMFLQGYDHESLAMIFSIDGLFLLNMFRTYNSEMGYDHGVELPKDDKRKRLLAQDVLMVENQIPFILLKEIDEALHSSLGNSSISSNNFSRSIFQTFCEIYSPLKLCSESQAPTNVEHLLHYMYYSIVNNPPIEKPYHPLSIKSHMERFINASARNNELRTSPFEQAYNFFTKIPQKEIVKLYKKAEQFLKNFSDTKFVLIPSASELHVKLGIKFFTLVYHKGIENIGIQNIGISRKNMFLPCITLNSYSGVILRNLVAYEIITSTSDSFPLTEYMGLMCALIMNVDDVKLLKSENVIKGDLGDDKVTKLFIGLSSSIPTKKTKGKSEVKEMIDEVNKVYESGVRMKTYLLMNKLARLLLVVLRAVGGFAVGGFAEASWKIVAFVASIVTVFMLTSQAYCDVYGCDKTTMTMLPFASS